MNGMIGMKNVFLDRQINEAKENCNYFFIKLIFCVLKNISRLALLLLISSIFNYLVINIIALIYTFYSLFNIIYIFNYYTNVIKDINDTLGINEFSFEIDFGLVNGNIFKGVLKYGK